MLVTIAIDCAYNLAAVGLAVETAFTGNDDSWRGYGGQCAVQYIFGTVETPGTQYCFESEPYSSAGTTVG